MRAIALLAVASQMFYVAAWIESRVASNIFLDRYLFPLSLVWMLAIAFVADSLVARLWQREPPEAERGMGISLLQDGLWGRRLVLATAVVLTMFVAMKTLRPRRPASFEVEALQAIRERPEIPVVTTDVLLHSVLGWYRRPAGGVVMLSDSHLHRLPIGVRIGEALGRHYLPGTMKSLAECVDTFDSFLYVNCHPERTAVEAFLSGQPGWRSTTLGPHTKLWERIAEGAAE